MTAYTENLTESITYWPPGENDGFGGTAYGDPVPISARWQQRQILFRDAQGREKVSEAVVYVSQPLENGGRLLRAESVAATPPSASREIRSVQASDSLAAEQTLHKVIL